MYADERRPPSAKTVIWSAALLASAIGLIASVAILSSATLSAMRIGDRCAEVPDQELPACTDGIPSQAVAAVWAVIVLLLVARKAISVLAVPNLLWLMWPALFVPIAINMIGFGVERSDANATSEATSAWVLWGWLYLLVGLAPVVVRAVALVRYRRHGSEPEPESPLAVRVPSYVRIESTPLELSSQLSLRDPIEIDPVPLLHVPGGVRSNRRSGPSTGRSHDNDATPPHGIESVGQSL